MRMVLGVIVGTRLASFVRTHGRQGHVDVVRNSLSVSLEDRTFFLERYTAFELSIAAWPSSDVLTLSFSYRTPASLSYYADDAYFKFLDGLSALLTSS